MSRSSGVWSRVRFGDVVRLVRDRVDPETSGLSRYVAGEHMDTDDLRIRRWGEVGDGYLGPAFHMRFQPGHVLYGSRRTYLRKVAVADFEGICANTTFVLESADPSVLLPELLPFVMQTEAFHSHSIKQSKGSVNPYVNFSDLAWYEFDLPLIEQQQRIAAVGMAIAASIDATKALADRTKKISDALGDHIVAAFDKSPKRTIYEICDPDRPLCYGVVQPGGSDGEVPLLRVCDLSDDGEVASSESLNRITRAVDEQYRRSRVQAGDVLVSVVGTIGRIAVVNASHSGANIARALARISPRRELMSPEFLAATLATPVFQSRLLHGAFETARKTLNLSELGQMRVPCPSLSEQQRLVDQVTALRAAAFAARERTACTSLSFQRFLLPSTSD